MLNIFSIFVVKVVVVVRNKDTRSRPFFNYNDESPPLTLDTENCSDPTKSHLSLLATFGVEI